MKNQTQKFYHHEQQNDTSPTTMTEYLTIIRNFILQMHQRVNEEFDPQVLPSNLISIIDKATVKLKTNKEQLSMLQKENRDLSNTKILVTELKSEQTHMQKRVNQKNDQISILRETVKTLYADNQRLNAQKQKISKQLITAKQSTSQMKKKLKKQDEQMTKHKQELQKLTKIAEQRLGEYASEDKQKQKSIKKMNQQIQRQKSEISKLNKNLDQIKRTNEDLLKIKSENQGNVKLIDALRYQNQLCKRQNQNLQQSMSQKSKRLTQQLNSVINQLSLQSQKSLNLCLSVKQLQLYKEQALIKIRSYEEDITIRTQKLKQKTIQLQRYDEQISKLLQRIEDLSSMSDQVIKQNQTMSHKCDILQGRLEQVKTIQQYISKIKGDINYSKSMELGRLIEALGNIRGNI